MDSGMVGKEQNQVSVVRFCGGIGAWRLMEKKIRCIWHTETRGIYMWGSPSYAEECWPPECPVSRITGKRVWCPLVKD